jgi:glycosyltransferase involved in cell wall biosynthesis
MGSSYSSPLVSIVTPVYNGAPYLEECIESILTQTYSNWEYTLVNNASTDRTLEIAERYARRDQRIRVITNSKHVGIVENHNCAVRMVSGSSKYCKVVEGDDWLYPDCLKLMVELAEAHPRVGIVGAYGLFGARVAWDGLPHTKRVVDGREICRLSLLGRLAVFGSPTTTLLRSDLVRNRDPFYNEANIHSDLEVCYEILLESDFGFVHQVLTFTRTDNESTRTLAQRLNSNLASSLYHLSRFGRQYLDEAEYTRRMKELIDEYYQFLAWSVFPARGKQFWRFHREQFKAAGRPFSRWHLVSALRRRFFDAALNPKRSVEGVLQWLSQEVN